METANFLKYPFSYNDLLETLFIRTPYVSSARLIVIFLYIYETLLQLVSLNETVQKLLKLVCTVI